MTKLEQLSNEIALFVFSLTGDKSEASREALAGTIMELALEIKRATIEGEW